MQRVWFFSTKGGEDNIRIAFMDTKGKVRNFNARRNFEGMVAFISANIDVIVSFEYSLYRLTNIAPELFKSVKLINLKDMFRELLILFKDEQLDRNVMMAQLGHNIRKTEPDYPRAHSDQTCKTYQAIYNTLQELSEF